MISYLPSPALLNSQSRPGIEERLRNLPARMPPGARRNEWEVLGLDTEAKGTLWTESETDESMKSEDFYETQEVDRTLREEAQRKLEELASDEGSTIEQLQQRLRSQLDNLRQAVKKVAGEEDKDSCSSSSVPRRSTPKATVHPDFLPAEEHYVQALDQARELYLVTDPDVSGQAREEAAKEAAWMNTLAEAVKLGREVPPERWPEGWQAIMVQASEEYHKDKGKSMQVDVQVRSLPTARRMAKRNLPGTTTQTKEEATTTQTREETIRERLEAVGVQANVTGFGEPRTTRPPPPPPTTTTTKTTAKGKKDAPPRLNRWQALVKRMQERRRWSARTNLERYSRRGVPKDLDGPTRGFGHHLGRWQWREIHYEWS